MHAGLRARWICTVPVKWRYRNASFLKYSRMPAYRRRVSVQKTTSPIGYL
jgi:hypothetical protein